jgi:predicted ester cyclase
MSQTKQIALDFHNRINAKDDAGAAALMVENCINHAAVPEAQGRAGFLATMKKLRGAFPDMKHDLQDVIVDGDRAVLRVTASGTNTGELGFVRFQHGATGKRVEFEQIHIVRVADGKVAEHWMSMDAVRMFRQLGLKVSEA